MSICWNDFNQAINSLLTISYPLSGKFPLPSMTKPPARHWFMYTNWSCSTYVFLSSPSQKWLVPVSSSRNWALHTHPPARKSAEGPLPACLNVIDRFGHRHIQSSPLPSAFSVLPEVDRVWVSVRVWLDGSVSAWYCVYRRHRFSSITSGVNPIRKKRWNESAKQRSPKKNERVWFQEEHPFPLATRATVRSVFFFTTFECEHGSGTVAGSAGKCLHDVVDTVRAGAAANAANISRRPNARSRWVRLISLLPSPHPLLILSPFGGFHGGLMKFTSQQPSIACIETRETSDSL